MNKNIILKLKMYFSRNYYTKAVAKNIYGRKYMLIATVIQLVISLFSCLCLLYLDNFEMFLSGIILIYINTFIFVFYEYEIKLRTIQNLKQEFGIHSEKYLDKMKQLLITGVGMTIGTLGYLCIHSVGLNMFLWKQYYWIWCVIIAFIGIFSRYGDIVTTFSKDKYMSGRYLVNFDIIEDIKIKEKKQTNKGEVLLVEFYMKNKKVGFDRFFSEDYAILVNKIKLRNFSLN